MHQDNGDQTSSRIFLVDDDKDVLAATSKFLNKKGFTVVEFYEPAIALAILAMEKPNLLMTDYAMPGLSGIVLAQESRLLHPDLPIIMVSGADKISIPESLCIEVFKKPPNWLHLLTCISKLTKK